MNSRRSWLIFGVGVFAYLVAVLQRTTLGVAGVAATERYDISAAFLSSLAVVQLIVYAAMQVPVGVLLDRLGSRFLMLLGTSLMVAGQLTLALAPSIGIAVLGRVLVGGGDAMIFISLIRLVNSWFTGRLVPQLSQWVGNIGQLGQILSAVPFAWVLHTAGWTPAFISAASVSVVALIALFAALADRPRSKEEDPQAASWKRSLEQLKFSFSRPGTQLGFWSHFITQSPGTIFSLLWGFPFMVYALGYSEGFAAAMLTIPVATGIVVGPVLGLLTARYPMRRSNLVLAIVVVICAAWALVLLWPGKPPVWVIVLLIVAMGIGGPGSLIGFDYARTFNPLRSLGSASGIVNVGGFLASFVTMFIIGVLLDLQSTADSSSGVASDLYSLDHFRVAFSVQYVILGFGVVFALHARRRTRRLMSVDEGIQVAPIWVALSNKWLRPRK